MQRWRANPSGVGSANQLWLALDEAFLEPVKLALDRVPKMMRSALQGDTEGMDISFMEGRGGPEGSVVELERYTSRDVFYWWKYGDEWRSRRRVWHCVVHGCATARDADWW